MRTVPDSLGWSSLPCSALLVVMGCQTGARRPAPRRWAAAGPRSAPATGTVPATRGGARGGARPGAPEGPRASAPTWANKTFEEFESTVFKEPFPGGKYIVNGDIAIADRKQLQEFFETSIKREPPQTRPGQLIVARAGRPGRDLEQHAKKQLTYCVSTTFGARHASVVSAMQAAGAAWAQVADVAFVYVATQDANCTASNGNVVFDVRPVNVNGEYLARAFFPNEPRAARNVLIDDSSFQLDPAGKLTLRRHPPPRAGPHPGLAPRAHAAGVRHLLRGQRVAAAHLVRPLLGHALPAVQRRRRLVARPDELRQERRRVPVRRRARASRRIRAICPTAPHADPSACGPQTQAFNDQRVAQGEEKAHGPFTVTPGSRFEVEDGRRRRRRRAIRISTCGSARPRSAPPAASRAGRSSPAPRRAARSTCRRARRARS